MPDERSCIEKDTAEGNVMRVLLCGEQADGTVTPVLVNADGKLITTTS